MKKESAMRTRTKLVSLGLAVVLPLAGMVNAGAEEKPAQGKQETGVVAPLLGQTVRLVMPLLEMRPVEIRLRRARAPLLVRMQLLARVLQGSLVKKLVEAV